MSSADLVVLRSIKEVTIGVTPPTAPALKPIRFTGESLNFNITNTKTNEIRPDRTETDLVQTAAAGGGDINFEFSFNTYKDYLASVLCSSWATVGLTEELKNGIVLDTYTIQKHFQDTTPAQFHNYTGCAIESMSLKMALGKIVDGSFTIMSFGCGVTTSQFSGATFPAATTTTPMNSVTNVQDFTIAGVPYSGCISSLSLMIKNNIRAISCIGSLKPKNMKLGTIEISGDVEFHFNEGSTYAMFVAGTEFPISFKLVDPAGNSYLFDIPRVKFETGQVVAGGKNTDVMFSAKFRGLFDLATNKVIKITATPAV